MFFLKTSRLRIAAFLLNWDEFKVFLHCSPFHDKLYLPMSSSFENLSGLAVGGPALPGVAGALCAGKPWLPALWLQ